MTRVLMAVAVLLLAGSAWAQSAYVGGAVAAEVVRTSSTKSGSTTYDSGDGESFGGAIRVGTFFTEHVGVELEYFRPGEIESSGDGPIYLAGLSGMTSVDFSFTSSGPAGLIYPIMSQSMRVRTSTTSALLTARQPLGGRVELVYLGGVGFSRVVREIEYGFPRIMAPIAPTIVPNSTRTTQYAAGPMVGMDVRVGMTEHAQLVGSLRVHTLGQALVDGWMIRPSVGLAWKF